MLSLSEKGMTLHSSTLAWKIPRTEEPGRLQSMGSWRVGHDWSDLAATAAWFLNVLRGEKKLKYYLLQLLFCSALSHFMALNLLPSLLDTLIAQLVKNPPPMQETLVWFLGQEDPLEKVFLGFPCGSAGKESVSNAGDLGSIPGLRRSPGGGYSHPLQYSCLENPMDRGA